MNNNNQPENFGVSTSFGNAGIGRPCMPPNVGSLQQTQSQGQLGVGSQGQFQLAQAQAQALSQAQSSMQAQALYAQLQAQGLFFNPTQVGRPGGLNSSSPLMSSAGNSSAKRTARKPPGRPQGSTGIGMMSPVKSPMELSSAGREKEKHSEKLLPENLAALLPESSLYTQLREFEARVDAALTRKKVDIQESLKNPPAVQKTLRIYVFNTFSNQNDINKPNAEPPTWSLKIIGRILEDGIDPEPEQAVKVNPNPIYPKFSAFFKKITISLDQELYPDNYLIMWDSSCASAHHEGFEIKRVGDKEFTANIRLEMNYMPEKFKLSPDLAELLGIEVDTRPRIIAAIWHYVKRRNLRVPNNPSYFTCDPPLQKLFGEEKMTFTMVSQKIAQHLFPPQAIILEHQVNLSGNNPATNACYDILVDIPFPIQRELGMLLVNSDKEKELKACDEAIRTEISKIYEHRRRRALFLGFSQSPVEFIKGRGAEMIRRRSDFFNSPWVEDASMRYFTRKPASGTGGPGRT